MLRIVFRSEGRSASVPKHAKIDALSDTEYRDEDGNQMKEDGIREHGQYRAAKLRKPIADLRTSFGRFRELCGTGKKVKPSVEGIKLLTLAAFLHCH